nr:aluminum-activated malate transporter 9 [Quercus suber]
MNGKRGNCCIEINISSSVTKAGKKSGGNGFSCKAWIWSVWKFCKEDSNRVLFSFKVGLAVLLVSLLILFEAPYEVFGTNIIWSILTVAIMFEYTVGATFNRGFNRALGSLLAGILAIIVAQFAIRAGRIAEPFIIGASIFLIGTLTSFIKQWPSFVPYEYGFRVILFTFCLIIVSGYREQLHQELVNGFNAVADSLEECVKKYLEDEESEHPEFTKNVMDDFPDEPAYKKCRTTLNSAAKLESLANAAKWEPPHGRFRHFFYPWSEYVKVGAVLRYCAYEVMALHGVLHSEIQAPYNLRSTFRSEILEAANQAAKLVKSLGEDIRVMKRSQKNPLIKKVHSSTEKLQRAIDTHSYLLTSISETPDTFSKPSLPSKLSLSLSSTPCDFSSQLANLDSNNEEKDSNPTIQNIPLGNLPLPRTESYHETMRKQSRRLHSWPSREVDAFEEEGGSNTDLLPRMAALESTAALSLATFTSLLIEFVARVDHLVEVVDKLSKMAKFKHEVL